MKCPVCGKVHQQVDCPRCSFPDIQVMGDWQTELKKLEPVMAQYREDLLSTVRIEIPVYTWSDSGGMLVQSGQEWMPIGDGGFGLGSPVWCGRRFGRIPDEAQLHITARVIAGEETRQVTLTVPNPDTSQLQELGAVVEADMTFRLLLRCQGQPPVSSEPVPLFV